MTEDEKLLKIELAAELLNGAALGYDAYCQGLQDRLNAGTAATSWPTVPPEVWDERGRAVRRANLATSLLEECGMWPEITEELVVEPGQILPEFNGKTIKTEMAYHVNAANHARRIVPYLSDRGWFRTKALVGWRKS